MHHQSEDYKLSTALRQTSSAFLFNRIFFLPLFLTGFPIEILATVNTPVCAGSIPGHHRRRMAMAKLYAEQGAYAVLVPCLLLRATLYTLGLFTEARSYAVRFELIRLLMIVPLSVAPMMANSHIVQSADEAWLIAGLYSLASVAGLKNATADKHRQARKVIDINFKTIVYCIFPECF